MRDAEGETQNRSREFSNLMGERPLIKMTIFGMVFHCWVCHGKLKKHRGILSDHPNFTGNGWYESIPLGDLWWVMTVMTVKPFVEPSKLVKVAAWRFHDPGPNRRNATRNTGCVPTTISRWSISTKNNYKILTNQWAMLKPDISIS